MERRVAVRAIVVHGGELLCAQLKPYDGNTSADLGDFWGVPGGTLEPSEGLVPGLERELVEETGVRPAVGSLLYIQQYTHGGREHLEFFFHVTNATDYLNIDLTKTTHGATEIARLEFINPAKHHVLPHFLTQQDFTTLHPTQTTKLFNYL